MGLFLIKNRQEKCSNVSSSQEFTYTLDYYFLQDFDKQ